MDFQLSVEDFNWQDGANAPSFSKMSKLVDSVLSNSYSFVDEPMSALMGLTDAQWTSTQLSLDLPSSILKKQFNSKYILVNMDDATSFEDRPHLLNRHGKNYLLYI
jgi:hypothetical protein